MERQQQEIDFIHANTLVSDNILSWKGLPYTVYDVDYLDMIAYLKHPELSNVGVPFSELSPILLTDETMQLCGFVISTPMSQQYSDTKCNIKTVYHLYKPEEEIDMTVSIIIEIDLKGDQTFNIPTIDQLDPRSQKICYLHQLQNIFKKNYHRGLIDIS